MASHPGAARQRHLPNLGGRLGTTARLVVIGLVGLSGACANVGRARSAAATLQAAASATARAASFTITVEGAEVTYQAPASVQQVEHGEASATTSSDSSTANSPGPHPETITKVFLADRYYEADSATGQPATFSVSQRCPGQANAAEYVLGILRAMATTPDIHRSGGGFAFQIPKADAVPFPVAGTATVAAGYVRTINLNPGAGMPPAINISSIDASPPVTAPAAASPSTMSCSSSSATGGSTGSATSLSPARP